MEFINDSKKSMPFYLVCIKGYPAAVSMSSEESPGIRLRKDLRQLKYL